MEACLVEGIAFEQDRNGYWEPCESPNAYEALAVLRAVVAALGFGLTEDGRRAYLQMSGDNPDEIKRTIAALLERTPA
jgi:hypothetical protein